MTRTALLLAGAALALPVSLLPAQNPERFTIGGDRVAIYDLAGAITVAAGTGSDVVVEVTRRGPDASRLRMETSPIRGVETFRVVYPADRIVFAERNWNFRTEMYVREDGTFGGDHNGDRGRRVRIVSEGDGLEAHANLRVLIPAGKTVSVNIGVGSLDASNVDGDITLDASAANITAEGMRGSLLMDTGSGNVTATNVQGTELNIDTGSGDVRVTGSNSADVTIDTGSGNVTGTNVTATDLSVDTGSGNIELNGVRATTLRMDTGSGDVEVALLSDTDNIIVDTGSGNVTIAVPSGFGSTVNLSTSSGDVDTELEIQVTRRGRQHLVGRIGDGQGRMTIETGSGNVTLRSSR
jgi:lia operon protein LiaG